MTGAPARLLWVALAASSLAAGCRPEEGTARRRPVAAPPSPVTAQGPGRASPKGPDSGTAFSFRTVGAESGLDFERYDDIRGQRRILEANGEYLPEDERPNWW